MPNRESKRVLAVVNDLFFSVKLTEAAKHAGLGLEFAKEHGQAFEMAKARPSLVVLDLNFEDVQPLDLIKELKASQETKGVRLIGYLSHIQAELKQQAQEAGCDMVLARSAFSQNMYQLFKRHAGVM